MMKDADFIDKIADISCNDLRDSIYRYPGTWDIVVVSQDWDAYDSLVRNFAPNVGIAKWDKLLRETIDHFSSRAGKVIILGDHLRVNGAEGMRVTMSASPKKYLQSLSDLSAEPNKETLTYFNSLKNDDVLIINPSELFCHYAAITR